MRDTIFLQGLEARGIIGVTEWERRSPQTIRIDLEMACDASRAAENDDIRNSIDYRSVAKAILAHVESHAYQLVETLAERLAAMVREDFGVAWLKLRVSKPGAVRFSRDVGIEVVRGERPSGA